MHAHTWVSSLFSFRREGLDDLACLLRYSREQGFTVCPLSAYRFPRLNAHRGQLSEQERSKGPQQRCQENAEFMVLFEAVNVVIHFGDRAKDDLRSRSATLLESVIWAANKLLETSKFKLKFPRARNLEIIGLVLGCIEAKFCK